MSVIVRSVTATVFLSHTQNTTANDLVDTACTKIEREILDLVEEHERDPDWFPILFVDNELEDVHMSFWDLDDPVSVPMKIMGTRLQSSFS